MFESVFEVLTYICVLCTIVVLVNGYFFVGKMSIGMRYYMIYAWFITVCTILCVISFIVLVLMFVIGILGGWIG